MAISSLFPILLGLIVLLVIMSEYSFFPLRYEDRFNLFSMLFGGALVFFIRRWSIKWNEQIKNGQIPDGDKINEKVNLITQLMLSLIPFINFTAFARIYCFQRALMMGIPTYVSMVFVTNVIINNNTAALFYPVYLSLTSTVFLVFMYRWTTRFNLGKYDRWADSWKNI